jgi:hypothetical protein
MKAIPQGFRGFTFKAKIALPYGAVSQKQNSQSFTNVYEHKEYIKLKAVNGGWLIL